MLYFLLALCFGLALCAALDYAKRNRAIQSDIRVNNWRQRTELSRQLTRGAKTLHREAA